MNMVGFEISCWAIVVIFLTAGAWRANDPKRFVMRYLLLTTAAWIGENSCIELYGFYSYSPRWSLFIGHVPLLIVAIWPAVILSGAELVQMLGPGRRLLDNSNSADRSVVLRHALLCGAIILADASLIEPVAVNAELWVWHQPGLFRVPPIGIIGWAFFATFACGIFAEADRSNRGPLFDWQVLIVGPLGTHLALLVAWWGLFRWINTTLPAWPLVGALWIGSVALTAQLVRRRSHELVRLATMLLRIPPALLFLYLLIRDGGENWALYAWFAAFCPPYLTLVPRGGTARSAD